jgi:hypothetical protein
MAMAASHAKFGAIDIAGGEEFVNQVVKSLTRLDEKSHAIYSTVEAQIDKIQEAQTSWMMPDKKTLYIGQQEAFPYRDEDHARIEELDLCWCASYIALESYRLGLPHEHQSGVGEQVCEQCCDYQIKICRAIEVPYYLIEILEKRLGKDIVVTTPSEIFDGKIQIFGRKSYINHVKASLELLKSKAENVYNTVKENIGRIREHEHDGMQPNLDPPLFDMSFRTTFGYSNESEQWSRIWCAGSIAHDSLHSQLYRDYMRDKEEPIPAEVYTGTAVELKCIQYQIEICKKLGAPEHMITYLSNQDGTHHKQ